MVWLPNQNLHHIFYSIIIVIHSVNRVLLMYDYQEVNLISVI